MRGLAEYAMHGRRQAIIVVLLCGFLPWTFYISAAVVGLVNLRKDTKEGLLVLLWSLIPAGFHWANSDIAYITPAILMISVAGLSQLLKRNDSWQSTILASVVLGVLIQLSLTFQSGLVSFVETLLLKMTTVVVDAQIEQGIQGLFTAQELTAQWLQLWIGFYGAHHSAIIVLCLILARWWQSALYNPGGFQQEFHQLRFDPRLMLVLAGLIGIGLMAVKPFDAWLNIFCIPALFAGMAVLHAMIAHKKMGNGWLVLCYVMLLLASPIIVIIGFLDSVFDLRKRITT